jgi:hypothetical protein
MKLKLAVRSLGRKTKLFALIALGCSLDACLPADTRPPPGRLLVDVTSDASLSPSRTPFETEDGWSISFERFLLGIGNTGFNEEQESCNDYQGFGSQYGRLLDLAAQETQRLSEMRFLGICSLSFEVAEPRPSDVLGQGVTDAELLAMRYPADDAFTKGRGVALRATGSARQGDRVKHFDWAFRQRLIFEDCRFDDASGIELSAGGDEKTIEIVVSGAVLFQRAVDDTRLSFDAFAVADDVYGDADGNVTLEEMAEVALDADGSVAQGGNTGAAGSTGAGESNTLAELVYLELFPQVARYRGDGTCEIRQTFHAEEPGEGGPGDD